MLTSRAKSAHEPKIEAQARLELYEDGLFLARAEPSKILTKKSRLGSPFFFLSVNKVSCQLPLKGMKSAYFNTIDEVYHIGYELLMFPNNRNS